MSKTKTLANPQAKHPMSPAERTALLLAFKRNFSNNYTPTPTPSKLIHVASSHFATS